MNCLPASRAFPTFPFHVEHSLAHDALSLFECHELGDLDASTISELGEREQA